MIVSVFGAVLSALRFTLSTSFFPLILPPPPLTCCTHQDTAFVVFRHAGRSQSGPLPLPQLADPKGKKGEMYIQLAVQR